MEAYKPLLVHRIAGAPPLRNLPCHLSGPSRGRVVSTRQRRRSKLSTCGTSPESLPSAVILTGQDSTNHRGRRLKAVSEDRIATSTNSTSSSTSTSASPPADAVVVAGTAASASNGDRAASAAYNPSQLDDFFLMLFRRKLVKETGWQSRKKGYDGMIEEAKKLLAMSPERKDAEDAAVRILLSFFPPGLLPLFKKFIAPAWDGKLGPILSALVTLVTCQWLMGPSKSSEVVLADGTTLRSGVKIEKCRFLEETKCAGSCIHTCKMPTQAFMQQHMGVPLYMEPNYEDFSCEFKFGVAAPPRDKDDILTKPCLSICPVASSRTQPTETCPEVAT